MIQEFGVDFRGTTDVIRNFQTSFKLLTNKCMSLFKIEGLPDYIDKDYVLKHLILGGKICFTEIKGKLYAVKGSIGGEPNAYYKAQFWICANPVLGSKKIRVRKEDGDQTVEGLDGVVVFLTKLDEDIEGQNSGLYNLIYKYSGLLADNDVSLNIAQLNSRLSVVFAADDEAEARTAEKVLEEIYMGKPYRVLVQNILEKIVPTPVASAGANNTIMSLIEARAHLLQDFYSEIGIASNGNLKRERVNVAETELMTGCLDISIWNMIAKLKEGFERVNELFGTSITVELNDEIFYAGSANATLGDEDLLQSDDEFQVDGVEEDNEVAVQEADEKETEAVKEEKEDSKEGDD